MPAGRIHALAISAVLILPLFSAFSAEDSAGRLSEIESAMKTVSTLSADFVQEKKIKFLRHQAVAFQRSRPAAVASETVVPVVYIEIQKSTLLEFKGMPGLFQIFEGVLVYAKIERLLRGEQQADAGIPGTGHEFNIRSVSVFLGEYVAGKQIAGLFCIQPNEIGFLAVYI